MAAWSRELRYDPIAPLLGGGDETLVYFARRDLLDDHVPPVSTLWNLPEVAKLLVKQQPDGSFPYLGKQLDVYPPWHYPLVETWRRFRILVDKYGMSKSHAGCRGAAEFLLSCQADEGDIRGMIGNQYATYYTGAILGLLIRAGYAKDARVDKGIQWLLSMRQDDGGWTVSMLTHPLSRSEQYRVTSENATPLEPNRARPFSHNWTGMVLRAFAAHPRHRRSRAARRAGELLKSRFFEQDVYGSYKAASYWVRFEYPFWWNNLVAALDTLADLGFTANDPDIHRGLQWLVDHQGNDGLWNATYVPGKPARGRPALAARPWISLSICRVMRRLWRDVSKR